MNGIAKREFLAAGIGLGVALALPGEVLAQAVTPGGTRPKLSELPHRMAKTTKLFKAPEMYPNALAVADNGVWIGQQKLKGIQAAGAHVPEQPGLEKVWLLDWNGKLLKTLTSKSEVTSGLAYGNGCVWIIANNENDYPPPLTGVFQVDMSNKTLSVRQIPLGGGGCHGAQWHEGKLWIVANRLNAMIRVDPVSWVADYAIPIVHSTPDTERWHDMTFDNEGFIWVVTGNESKRYAAGQQGLAKYDPKTGKVLELVSLVPGSCDPHGLGFHNGAFVAVDAGHHPGWPDQDSPGSGWIFRIDLI